MNLKISGHHLELTPSLREFVVNKLERVLRHFDQLIGAEVILSVDKTKEKTGRQIASVTVYLKGKEIFVEKCDENMYAARSCNTRTRFMIMAARPSSTRNLPRRNRCNESVRAR